MNDCYRSLIRSLFRAAQKIQIPSIQRAKTNACEKPAHSRRTMISAIVGLWAMGFGNPFGANRESSAQESREKKSQLDADLAFAEAFFIKYSSILRANDLDKLPFTRTTTKLDPEDGWVYRSPDFFDTTDFSNTRYRYYLHRAKVGFFLVAIGGYGDLFGATFGPLPQK